MNDDESGHYLKLYGDLLSQDGPLVSVPDLVRWRMRRGSPPLPLRPAVCAVLDAILATARVAVYVTQPGTWAVKVRDAHLWQSAKVGRPAGTALRKRAGSWATQLGDAPTFQEYRVPAIEAVPELRGRDGLLAAVRRFWSVAKDEEALYATIRRGQLAILEADAVALFPALLLTDETEGDAIETAQAEDAETDAQRRERAMSRVAELTRKGSKGVRKKVAAEFGIDVRTVGKWLAEAKEAAKVRPSFSQVHRSK